MASINAGLEEAGAGIIAFSRHSRESRWVEAEVSYLTYARIQEEKILIPVRVSGDAWVPPLLRPLARRGIEEIDAIAQCPHARRRRAHAPRDAETKGRPGKARNRASSQRGSPRGASSALRQGAITEAAP